MKLLKTICLIFCLTTITNVYSKEIDSWSYKDWETTSVSSGYLRSITHGKITRGNEFGIVKSNLSCEQNILWLTIGTDKKNVDVLKNKEIDFNVTIDKETFSLKLPATNFFELTRTFTIVGFSNFLMSDLLIDKLKNGAEIVFEITGPEELKNKFDIPDETFSLAGFTANYVKLSESCKDLTQLEIPPNKVVSKADVPKKTYQVRNEIKNHSQCSNNGLSDYVNQVPLRANEFTFLNNQLYFGFGNDGQDEYEDVYVANVCNPSNPLPVTRINGSASQIHGMYAHEKVIYIDSSRYDSAEDKSYSSLKIISSDTYKILSEITVPTFINPFVVDGERLYLTSENKVNIYDLGDKSNPKFLSDIDVSSIDYPISGIDVDDGLIYIVGDSDLLIYDRKTLKIVAHKTFQYRTNSIIVSENRAILTLWNNGGSNDFVAIINLQDINDVQIETIQKIQDSELRRVNSNFVVQDSYVGKVKLIELNSINGVFNKLIAD